MTDIAKRFARNPILTPADISPSMEGLQVEGLLNPGVFEFEGKTWLLLRVAERPAQVEGTTSLPVIGEDGKVPILEFSNADHDLDRTDPRIVSYRGTQYLTTLSHLRLVCSENGIDFNETSRPPLTGQGEYESYGIEDCRVTRLGEVYCLTYTQVSPNGVGVGLRTTANWRDFVCHGMILPPHNKDCALFDAPIGGRHFLLHRPSSVQVGGNYLWLAESPDLLHWGNHRCIARTRPGMWDSARIGAGAAPIRTAEGWLAIYHGADEAHRYCLGALLLDLEEPGKVLGRSAGPIMEPLAPYERTGFFGNVVFTNGHLVHGDDVTIYYGASDSVICAASFSVAEILATLR